MFYVLVGLWLLAGILAILFRRLQRNVLEKSCPCLAVGGLLAASLLFFLDQTLVAVIVALVSLYLAGTLLWSLNLQRNDLKKA